MAEFCNICISHLTGGNDLDLTNVGDIMMGYTLANGGDFNFDNIFEEHIKPEIDMFLEEGEDGIALSIPGICEHCGLVGLKLIKEEEIYLVALCLKSKDTHKSGIGQYKIAVVKDDGLEYIEEECLKLYNEK